MLEKIQKFLIESSQINELFLEGKYPTLSPSNTSKNIGMPQEGFYWILLLMQRITILKGYFKGRKLGKTEKIFRTNFAHKTFAKRKILISNFSKSLLIKSLLEIKKYPDIHVKKIFHEFWLCTVRWGYFHTQGATFTSKNTGPSCHNCSPNICLKLN